ncbi:MAG: D-glycero-beta-D-manno-heptose 1-phosphate adenylyltransferase [Candidatus Omnitrophica bacterium]|nr:D-glycero-beta-D-manno-heptose 1-phosphate adenylyltransferase [Candidatus Omnitrophota bacterium]
MKDKIKSAARLGKTIAYLKGRGKKVVFTNGCFDIIHKGHIKLLEKAGSLGDILIVAINSDNSVKKIKGIKRPINSARDRALVLSAIDVVDYVTTFSEPDPARIISKLKPDILVKGGDWKKHEVIGGDVVESCGGKVVTVRLEKGYSTTRLINAIRKQSR